MIRLTGLLMGAALALLSHVVPSPAAEFTLRFGSINGAGTLMHEQILTPFARALEERSGGRIAVDLRPVGGFGKPVEHFPMVERGEMEIATSVQGYHPGRFPRSSVMELPMMFDTAEQGTNVLWSLFEEGKLGDEYDSVKVLAIYTLPPYGIFVAPSHNVSGLRDLRGLRIRAPGVTGGLALARLGAIPIGLPLNLIGPTIEENLSDGMAFGWDSGMTTRAGPDKMLTDLVSSMVDANFAAPTMMTVMNRKTFESLPPELRKVVDELAGREFALANARARDSQEAAAKARFRNSPKHRVITLNADERRELSSRIAPVVDDWVTSMKSLNIDGAALLGRARALGANS